MTDHDTIVIRAPSGTKTRWVRQSQAQHRKLSDWILDAVDRPANKIMAVPCPSCRSFVLVANGPGAWQCAMCGVVA